MRYPLINIHLGIPYLQYISVYVISFDQYTLINFGDGVPISTMENGNIYVSSYVAMRYPLINIHTMGSPYLQMENSNYTSNYV